MVDDNLDWIVSDADGSPIYRVFPYSNGMCYNLYEWKSVKKRDGSEHEEWVHTGKYPTDISHAVSIMKKELLMKRGGSVVDFSQLEASMRDIANILCKALGEVKNGHV